MEEEIEVGGSVEEISGQWFVVSADLNHERRYLWCKRERFFHNGQPCRESLDNVLELLMPIDVLVRSERGDYNVLAAWIGDKPEIIEVDDRLLHPVYGKQGNLCRSQKDGSVVIAALEDNFSVLIRKGVVYLNGYPQDNGMEDLLGQVVSFDAVPMIQKDTSGAIYAATCVWVGETVPRIVDRFQLHGCGELVPHVKMEVLDSDDELELLESPPKRIIELDSDSDTDDDIQIMEVIIRNDSLPPRFEVQEKRSCLFEKFAVGTVCVILNEVLAFVDVCVDDIDVKVMLFRHSFEQCYNIRDILSVGDRLCLLLRSFSLFLAGNTWIVVKACKGNYDPKRMAEMMLPVENDIPVSTERVSVETATGASVGRVPVKEESSEILLERVPVEESMPRLLVERVPVEVSVTSGLPVELVPVGESTSGLPVERVPVGETRRGLPVEHLPLGESTPGLSVEPVVQRSSLNLPEPAEIEIVEMSDEECAIAVPMETGDDVRAAVVPVKVDTLQRAAQSVDTRIAAVVHVKVDTLQRAAQAVDTRIAAVSPVVVKREIGVVNTLPAIKGTQTLKAVVLKPFAKQFITQDVVLNGTGLLVRRGTFYVAEMQSLPIKVLIRSHEFYVNDRLCLTDTCVRNIGREVKFDAVKLKKSKHSSGATHRAVLNWQGVRPTPQAVLKQAKLNPTNRKIPFCPNTVYVGVVMEVPLFDCCIVKFGAVPVLVQSKSLLVDPWTKDTSPIVVHDYLKFGDHVALTCKVEDNCVVAEVCGTLPSFDSLFGAIGTLDRDSLSVPTNDVNVSHSQAETELTDVLRCTPMYLDPTQAYKGVIVEFPYRNYGIALVGEIRVLVHINCLVDVQGKRGDVNSMSELLIIGSSVFVWVDRKSMQFTSYYTAREARLILENSSKNKVVLKNYNGLVQSIKFKCSAIQICGGRHIEADIHYYRLNPFSVPRTANVSMVDRRLRGFSRVRVSATVNDENVVIHSVLLLLEYNGGIVMEYVASPLNMAYCSMT